MAACIRCVPDVCRIKPWARVKPATGMHLAQAGTGLCQVLSRQAWPRNVVPTSAPAPWLPVTEESAGAWAIGLRSTA